MAKLSNTMAYIGFPLSLDETLILMENTLGLQGYDTTKIVSVNELNEILAKFTDLRIFWIDKNQYVFGIDLKNLPCQFWLPLLTVDHAVIRILEGKRKFKEEITRLNLDLSELTFCHMEEEDSKARNPEPLFFVASF